MKKCSLLYFLFSLACAGPALTPEPTPLEAPPNQELITNVLATKAESQPLALRGEASINKERLLSDVKTLSQPSWEGRGASTIGLEHAAEFLAKSLQQMGLSPGGDNQTYFQSFEVIVGVERGAKNFLSDSIAGAIHSDSFTPLSMSGNGEAKASVVFVGYGRTGKPFSVDEYVGLDVKNKIVVIIRGLPEDEPVIDDAKERERLTGGILLWRKAIGAYRRGAKAIIFIAGPQETDDVLPALTAPNSVGEMGLPVVQVKRSVVEGWLSVSGVSLDAPIKPLPLSVTVKLSVEITPIKARLRNVIGILTGDDSKSAALVLGAHYDHVGMGGVSSLAPEGTFAPHTGADDNASGTAALLSIANALSTEEKPRQRSIIVCFFSGEELGLLGSKIFVSKLAKPQEAVHAMLNLDMVGRLDKSVEVMAPDGAERWQEFLQKAQDGLPLEVKTNKGKALNGRSDHASFLRKGIPALSFFTGFHPDYHRPTDTWEKINLEGLTLISKLVFRLALLIVAS